MSSIPVISVTVTLDKTTNPPQLVFNVPSEYQHPDGGNGSIDVNQRSQVVFTNSGPYPKPFDFGSITVLQEGKPAAGFTTGGAGGGITVNPPGYSQFVSMADDDATDGEYSYSISFTVDNVTYPGDPKIYNSQPGGSRRPV